MSEEKNNALLERYLAGACTREEEEQVHAWLDSIANPGNAWTTLSEEKKNRWKKALFRDIKATVHPQPKYIRVQRTWLAAAAAVLVLAFGFWFLLVREGRQGPAIANVPEKRFEDIAPGGNKAVLTLADGSQVVLDSAGRGAISKQGAVTVIKLNDGQLSYQPSSSASSMAKDVATYNTITTPKGGQYQLVLADGTKVWLNAASSLRYPTAFVGNERRVELTGEGYFEVAHRATQPFRVSVRGMEVDVLGTHFNINAYSDEATINTTLLQGSVNVRSGAAKARLKPGQQAQLTAASQQLQVESQVDVEQVIAWKAGYFSFQNAGIQTIMRQLSRWYNVEVDYKGAVPEARFSGEIGRGVRLHQVLDALAQMRIHFKLEENKLIVMP